MKKNHSILSLVIMYFNTRRIEYSRQGLLKFVKVNYQGDAYLSENTIDNYRNLLNSAGYIVHTSKPGIYKKLCNVSTGMTTSKLRKEAYPDKLQ